VTHDDVTPANPERDEAALSHDAIGAYILGALPEDERIAFEAHLRECQSCQQELRELGPIAALLPSIYEHLDLPGIDPLPSTLEPSSEVRERIVAEAVSIDTVEAGAVNGPEPALIADPPTLESVDQSVEAAVPELEGPVSPIVESAAEGAEAVGDAQPAAEQVVAESEVESVSVSTEEMVTVAATAEEVEPEAEAPRPRRRPRGRIAPGEAPPEASVIALPTQRGSMIPWAVAAAASIIAVGAILWALAMLGQIDDLKDERDLQDQHIAQLNADLEAYMAQTPANVYPLIATTTGTSDARGIAYMDPDPNGWGGVIAFRGMSMPPSGQVYQLWMIRDGQTLPGPTFMPDQTGEAMVQVPGEAATAQAMAITMEPEGGSQTPSTTPILQGEMTA
jgi:anti-sigma-K factor RskA